MKNPVYLIILLALGLLFVSYRLAVSASGPDKENITAESTLSDIMSRTSVRAYSDRAISESQVDTLLRAAMAAPSAGNKQPWRFIVIRDTLIHCR